KKGHPVLSGPRATRLKFVEEHGGSFAANPLCHVVGVSTRGLR
ncbi:MAG TPA: IS3 family transposase, partial [Rhodobacteraceae bacterium]|nr:IS3 family transposase [Paracoccaceae bacterium]